MFSEKEKIKNFKKKKNKNFASCVMVCGVIKFVLRHFLGFLAGFYLFALQLIHFDKIRGLEWLKIRFCYSGIRIIMLLWYNKRGFAKVTRVRGCIINILI